MFDYSSIRPAGAPLRTSGGKAPGPEPLFHSLTRIEHIVQRAAGRQLRPIEAYDILMWAAKAVLSGGVRRSATICLFSADDEEMAAAKTGNWFQDNPQRTASNNSAVIVRGQATRQQFDRLFEAQKQFGEPGFYFVEDPEYGANPCVEIGLHPRLKLDAAAIARLRELGHQGELREGDTLSGVQFCNLTTVSAAASETPARFYELCAHAAVIGTLQAGYTAFEYLTPVSRLITEREALLGVSICGVLDRPEVLLDPVVLRTGAAVVKAINAILARALGINPAARTTCVKPEGTASLLLGTSSGLHPHHALRYFRRVQANVFDPVFHHFKRSNPHMVETSVYDLNERTEVITFPVEGPAFGIYRDDLSAVRHLEYVRLVQQAWVQAGRRHEKYSPGLHHNVSCTISVRCDEWPAVADFIWDNRQNFTGVALLQDQGDKAYAQAPREAVSGPEDIARWNSLVYQPVDYTLLHEEEDLTELKQVVACAGGRLRAGLTPAPRGNPGPDFRNTKQARVAELRPGCRRPLRPATRRLRRGGALRRNGRDVGPRPVRLRDPPGRRARRHRGARARAGAGVGARVGRPRDRPRLRPPDPRGARRGARRLGQRHRPRRARLVCGFPAWRTRGGGLAVLLDRRRRHAGPGTAERRRRGRVSDTAPTPAGPGGRARLGRRACRARGRARAVRPFHRVRPGVCFPGRRARRPAPDGGRPRRAVAFVPQGRGGLRPGRRRAAARGDRCRPGRGSGRLELQRGAPRARACWRSTTARSRPGRPTIPGSSIAGRTPSDSGRPPAPGSTGFSATWSRSRTRCSATW